MGRRAGRLLIFRDALTSVGACPRRGDGLSPRRGDASPRRASPTTNRYADTSITSLTRASPRRQAPIPAARNTAFYVCISSDGWVGIFSDGQQSVFYQTFGDAGADAERLRPVRPLIQRRGQLVRDSALAIVTGVSCCGT